ncbi:MAG: Hsp20/alpha crystallin family protein [Candidatus Sericytochromatia bacterium]|nr:Hsp20/alpha crystallin family protein [Candidatus Tanganyikabacteria bacterium]
MLLQSGYIEAPSVDANFAETPEAYLIAVELPGIEVKDISLQVVGQQLAITAFRKPIWTSGAVTAGFTMTEGRFGTLRRSISLPPDANATGVAAQHGNGLLTITIPKTGNGAAHAPGVPVANVAIQAASL